MGARTSLTVEPTEPVDAPRLPGAAGAVRVVRFHADDADALHGALAEALRPLPGPARPPSLVSRGPARPRRP
ncbi:hypothetical protein M2169_002067 [Streptomyces sp. MJP52]|nr:hypothetical protein [Streptomyces sp. MJP52]